MKKLLFISCIIAALVSCNKETPAPSKPQTLTFDFKIHTTKAVKTNWEADDVIFVFFNGINHSDDAKYLELKYYGPDWVATMKNGLTADDINNAADKQLTAVHLPYGNSTQVNKNGFAPYYKGWFLQVENASYTINEGVVSADLYMHIPPIGSGERFVQIFVENTNETAIKLYQDAIKPITLRNINKTNGELNYTEGNAGDALEAYPTDGGRVFSGVLIASEVGVKRTYDFSVDLPGTNTLYTCTKPDKTISDNTAIKLAGISNTAVWTATKYVDLGLTSDGKALMWAECNLGASTPEDYGLYFAWGSPEGFSYGSSHNFSVGYEPFTDAAHNTLHGLWRMPTKDDFDNLIENTTHPDFDPDNEVGMQFINKSDASAKILLPAAGFRDNTSIIYPGIWLCYWTSTRISTSPYSFNCNDAQELFTSSDNGRYGQTIRPVFTK